MSNFWYKLHTGVILTLVLCIITLIISISRDKSGKTKYYYVTGNYVCNFLDGTTTNYYVTECKSLLNGEYVDVIYNPTNVRRVKRGQNDTD